MSRKHVWALSLAALSVSCAQFMSVPQDATPKKNSCQSKALIEDGEDADDQIAVKGGRKGYWYTFKDEAGSDIAPREDHFTLDYGGVDESAFAVHMTGKLAQGAEVFAGVGFDFNEPRAVYDGSQYTGISFLAKRAKGSIAMVRLKAPDVNTDPSGQVCTDCYNDFGVTFEVPEEWTRFTVKFEDLKQEDGWGAPRPGASAKDKLYGLQWQVSTPKGEFDIWLDDIRFEGCPES